MDRDCQGADQPDDAIHELTCVLIDVVARRATGQDVSNDAVIAAHPDLMPELAERLRELGLVEQAHRRAAWPPGTDDGSSASGADMQTSKPIALEHRVRGYQVLGEVRRGGQGVVYRGIQDGTRRKVAIKVMHKGPFAGPRDRMRFEREVQILGALNHPNIVAIHECGEAAGCFYYVMDYVDGRPLDEHVEAATDPHAGRDHPSRVPIREILTLFAKICDAVNAAHLRGVIHRDLKPANILIDEAGEPHVLDFGLAKLVTDDSSQPSGMSLTGQFIGSLPWASPEQVSGNPDRIDIRTDVYSLGVVLYRLLAGRFPYEVAAAPRDVLNNITQAEPVRPSTASRHINDDVETIILKCLAKEPERRYQGAGELGSDIRRYLGHEPIAAKRDNALYVFRTALRRYRVPVAIAVSFVAVLTAGLVASLVSWRTARAERDEAQRIGAFMSKILAGVQSSVARGRDTEMLRELLDHAAARIDARELADAPKAEIRLRITIGSAYRRIGAYDAAENMLRPAVELAQRTSGIEESVSTTAIEALGILLDERGDSKSGLQLFESALASYRRQFPADHPEIARSLGNIAGCLQSLGRLNEALDRAGEGLAIFERLGQDQDAGKAVILNRKASCLEALGRADEALPMYEAALAIRKRLYSDEHPDISGSLHSVASCYKSLGRAEEALRGYEDALEMNRRLHRNRDHQSIAMGLNNTAHCLQALGRYNEALRVGNDALAMCRRLHKGDHPEIAMCQGNVAASQQSLGDNAGALRNYEETLAMYQRLYVGDHPDVAIHISSVGLCLVFLGRVEEGLHRYQQALAMAQRLHRGDHPDVASYLDGVAQSLVLLSRLEEALPLFEQALAMRRRIYRTEHPEIANSIGGLARCLELLGRPEEALPMLRESLAMFRRLHPPGHPGAAYELYNLASCLRELDRPAEALPLCEEAIELLRREHSGDHEEIAGCLYGLGACLKALGRPEDALQKLEESLHMHERLAEGDDPSVAQSLNNVGACLEDLNRPAEALEKYETAFAMYERLGRADQSDALNLLNNMASCLEALDRTRDAAAKLEDALMRVQRSSPEPHPRVARAMYRLADGLRTDDPARAQEICGQAVDLYRRHVDWPMDDSMSAFGLMAELCRDRGERAVASSLVNEALRHGRTATSGADHRAVANMLVHQGALLLKADDPGAAEPLLRECLAIRVSVLPPGDWLIADTKSMLGEALSRLGRFDEAEPLLLAGFNVIKAKPRAPAKAKRAALDRLIRHFEACGKSDQASEFRALASAGTHAEKND